MEIMDIILVTENWKGSETNSLMNVMDYLKFIDKDSWLSRKELAENMMELGRTLGEREEWAEIYFAANKTVSARYCADQNQLKSFLNGGYNTDKEWRFEAQSCSGQCLDYLKILNIGTDGRAGNTPMNYERLESTFAVGQILHNFNNHNYRVLECLSEKNLLLMDVKLGSFVVAVGTAMYRRTPKDMGMAVEKGVTGVEWDYGHYLSAVPSEIDFRQLKQEYGSKEKIKDLYAYRAYVQKQFAMLGNLSRDRFAPRSIQRMAVRVMYDRFGTDQEKMFMNNLENGKYDSGFNCKERRSEKGKYR